MYFLFFLRGRSATCTYPIGLVIGLLFRLGLRILIVSLKLNVSPIAPCSAILAAILAFLIAFALGRVIFTLYTLIYICLLRRKTQSVLWTQFLFLKDVT